MRSIHTMLAVVWMALAMPCFAGTLDEIRASNELKLAYRADTPPFSYRPRNAEPEGFIIDMCRRIARDIEQKLELESMKVTWVEVTAENRFDTIASGKAHIECGPTTVTLSRQERVDFSNLTYLTGATLMAWNDGKVHSVEDLAGKRVTVVAGTTTERVLKETLQSRNIDATVVVVEGYADALARLADRKVAAMAGDQATLLGIGFKSQGENNLVLTADMLSFETYALALPRNDADFRLAVNRSLSAYYLRGDVGRSWQRWFAQYNVEPTRQLLMLYRLNSFSE